MKKSNWHKVLAIGIPVSYILVGWPLGHLITVLRSSGFPEYANSFFVSYLFLFAFSPIIVALPASVIVMFSYSYFAFFSERIKKLRWKATITGSLTMLLMQLVSIYVFYLFTSLWGVRRSHSAFELTVIMITIVYPVPILSIAYIWGITKVAAYIESVRS